MGGPVTMNANVGFNCNTVYHKPVSNNYEKFIVRSTKRKIKGLEQNEGAPICMPKHVDEETDTSRRLLVELMC